MARPYWNILSVVAILWTIVLISFMCVGCGSLAEHVASDVGGWDISACVSGFDTCWELFTDNADKFEGGFVDAVSGIVPE